MSGPEFFQTPMGRSFFDGTMPKVAEALQDIVLSLNKINVNLERIIKLEEEARKGGTGAETP